jgi:hypothetical protein
MKKLLAILLLFLASGVYGQQVNAPEAKSFILSTSGQDASGFSLSGFNSTSVLLCAIGLPSAPSGTTFYLTTTTGLTPASGYTMSGNKTRLAFTGTMANINSALATLKLNTTTTSGNIQLSVSATVNPTGFFYNPTNGHFYRPISQGTTYTNARAAALATTFKGQQGYLVTITSPDEDQFIFNNVPQSNIWFALTDEVTEGRWVIDAGPEKGTVIKTSNGQTAGNIVGQYNNWAGGEPNNWGNNEDYAVTKWNGSQWNDLGNGHNNPYVIEYGTWTNPDDATFTEFYSNSTNHSNGNVLRIQFQYDFGSNINETFFRAKLFSNHNNIQQSSVDYTALNSLGKIDMTNGLDQTKITDGNKVTTTGGQVEWCVVYDYEPQNQRYQILIDKREFPQGVSAIGVTNLQLFDLWNGPVTYQWDDGMWAAYWIYTPTELNFSGSSFTSNIRRAGFFWGLSAEFTFTPNMVFKPHYSDIKYFGGTHSSLFSSIVTVSDVYLAFKQVADNGLFGNSNVWFATPIQFSNADVDSNGTFNEQDCFILLKHLLGETTIWSNTTDLGDMAKFIKKSEYDAITNNNWQNYLSTSKKYDLPIILDGQLNSYNIAVTWKGDVNLSHSAIPTGATILSTNSSANFVKSMSANKSESMANVVSDIMMEKIEEVVEVTILVTPNGNQIGATQFEVLFDDSLLEYVKSEYDNKTDINFARNNGNSIGIGTLNTSGKAIGITGYKLTFKPKSTIENILGLISVKNVETIDTKLNKLTIKIR